MLPATRPLCFVYLVFVGIFIFFYARLDPRFSHTSKDGNLEEERPGPDTCSLSEDDFIAAAIETAVEDDFNDGPISELCAAQEWDSSVVFTCRGIIGGIGTRISPLELLHTYSWQSGNIRQELLHCIRYTIDAGAGLILPTINVRSENELSNLENGTAPMDYLFDQTRFLSRVEKACPQMVIYKDLDHLKSVGNVTETKLLDVNKLSHWPLTRVDSARAEVQKLKAPSGNISLVPFENVWRQFPICHDDTAFADTFGSLLPLRSDVIRLAAKALYQIYTRYQLPSLDPAIPTTKSKARTFLGIHLRTANDILPYWLSYDDQVSYYLSHIQSSTYLSSLPVIYIASGNTTSITSFAAEIQSLPSFTNRSIITKNDLLSGPDLVELSNLTWDQQALVDLLVLTRSGYFMGMADSSFAWTISNQRRRWSKAGTCQFSKGWWKSKISGTAFEDEFSELMGNHGYGWEDKMWP